MPVVSPTEQVSDRRQRLYRTEAIVLKRRDYGEADRLVTVFTPQRGKLVLLAKGVRRLRSRKAGHLELFTLSTLLVAKGRTWDLVTQAETIEPFLALREDLLCTSYAHYFAELLDGFTQEQDSQPAVFTLFKEALGRLAAGQPPRLLARAYELRLLALAGYQPELFACVACQEPLEPLTNYFSNSDGGVLCPRHGEGKAGTERLPLPLFKALRFIQTRDWDTVMRLNLSPGLHGELERLLQGYIMYQLERNLRSVAFLRLLREWPAPLAPQRGGRGGQD